MSLVGGIVVFIVVWWLVLFCVLPIGIVSQDEGKADFAPGTDPGAPLRPRMVSKALVTTAIAIVITAGIWAYMRYDPFDIAAWLHAA
ncbi:DUF1467 family protein [Oceanibacterium hippocampi]|uniref:Uncharacterized protein n=1 Tax=Oceanibacterium hippocampi TaxID=745714 RepID=A0A1Y5T120_9PROT|nr:DUF1467 family protein [Oceanibacterium hippocampi]SLN53721.1 hypothetical protein OCH7691_02259 [Oceanibacterium hippocampi]